MTEKHVLKQQQCFCLSSSDGRHTVSTPVPDLYSSQEEADTRMLLHCQYASHRTSTETNIIVRSPDTDVLVILISYAKCMSQQILFDTGTGNKRRMISITNICDTIGAEVCAALPALHAFTGSDCISAFVRQGKVKPFKLLMKNSKFHTVFQRLGSSTEVTDDVHEDVQKFVCAMYGKPTYNNTDQARHDIFKSRYEPKSKKSSFSIHNGIDLSLLPPCSSTLCLHTRRANYQAYIWRNSHNQFVNIPSPVNNGWKLDEAGDLIVDWTSGDVLPQQLVDLLMPSKAATSTTETSANDQDEADDSGDAMYAYEIFENEIEEDDEVDNIIDVIFDDEDD